MGQLTFVQWIGVGCIVLWAICMVVVHVGFIRYWVNKLEYKLNPFKEGASHEKD